MNDTQQPIIVKRVKKTAAAAHGGAWKIAYADFVTAMMAFFLMLWLLGSTSQGDLKGITEYFKNPLRMAMQGGKGSGDSSSVVRGGGEDLSRKVGQVRKGDTPSTRAINLDAARQKKQNGATSPEGLELEKQRERLRLIDLKGRIEALIEANSQLRMFRNQILIDIISEGLRIQIVDEQNRPMFDSSSDVLRSYSVGLLRAIGQALNGVDNRISLSGHTDSAQYAGGERGFSNWELSANRANAARRELVAGGLEANKVVRVVGLSDTIQLDEDDPFDPINRRISIIVLNKESEEALRSRTVGQVSEAPVESVPEAMGLGRDIESKLDTPPGKISGP